MAEIAAIGVHNDLPACEARITGRTAHHKLACRIDVNVAHIPDVKAICSQHRSDDHLLHILPQVLNGKIRAMHNGHHHSLHAHRPSCIVKLHRHLGLPIGPQVGVLRHHLRQAVGQGTRDRTGQRHQLRGLVAGATKHHPLIASAAHLIVGPQGDVRRLGVNPALNLRRVGTEALIRPGIANVPDHLTGNGLVVHQSIGGDLPGDAAEICGYQRLTSHPGVGILRQAGVQNAVRNPIGHLVRVAGGDALRSKKSFFHSSIPFFSRSFLPKAPGAGRFLQKKTFRRFGTCCDTNPHLSSDAGFGTLNQQVAGLHRAVPSATLDKAYSISSIIICL